MRVARAGWRALLAAGFACLAASPAFAEPALWKVSDADSHVWMFGSIHILDGDRPWRSPAFDTALSEADLVYFELVLNAATYAEITRLTFVDGLNRKGETLDDYLTTAQSEKLKAVAEAHGVDYRGLQRMRPWLAQMTLLQQSGFGVGAGSVSAGVDVLIADEVDEARQRGLETPGFQMGLFSGQPVADQVESLMAAADALGAADTDSDEMLKGMIDAWMSGDGEALQEIIGSEVGSLDSEAYQALIVKRNHNWVEQISKMLDDNVEAMIIVGAGHLVGPEAVEKLLAERGYTVTLESAPPQDSGAPGEIVKPR